jgi:hypothetical protein
MKSYSGRAGILALQRIIKATQRLRYFNWKFGFHNNTFRRDHRVMSTRWTTHHAGRPSMTIVKKINSVRVPFL